MPKIKILGQKLWPAGPRQTDKQTNKQTDRVCENRRTYRFFWVIFFSLFLYRWAVQHIHNYWSSGFQKQPPPQKKHAFEVKTAFDS